MMISGLIVAAALAAQPPAPVPARMTAPTAQAGGSPLAAKRKARRAAIRGARAREEYADAVAAEKVRVAERERWDRELPARLELNRQMLARQSAYEANLAAHRQADASNRAARALEWAAAAAWMRGGSRP